MISVLWIPFIRNLNNEVFQYLQSVQAYVGAPITATFLVGILWRGATAAAALTTLLTGGVIGGSRFLMDILHNAMKMDLGPLNSVVEYSFLNFSVWVFTFCVLLMVIVSHLTAERRAGERVPSELRVGRFVPGSFPEVAFTAVVGVAIMGLWFHFR